MSGVTDHTPVRALVVGGGLLGGHVAASLAGSGHAVTVLSRSFNPWLAERVDDGLPIRLLEGAIASSQELEAEIEAAEIVFFMAGASTPQHAERHLMSSTLDSVLTAMTVLDLMRETSTRRIVVASSGGTIYGEPSVLPTPEDHPLEPISMHGMNSVVIEQYARFFARRHGFEVTVLRYSNVFGPGQTGRRGQGVVAAWCRALLREESVTVFGSLDVQRDFVFVDDAAEATVAAALTPGVDGVFNVGSGVASPLSEVLDLVGETAGRAVELDQRPARGGLDVQTTCLDCSRLALATGWSPSTSLAEGIRLSWEWLAESAGHLGEAARPDALKRPD